MHLIFMQAFIYGIVMIQYLDLAHAPVGSVLAHRGADADTVVDSRPDKAEIKPQDEVAVFLLRIKVTRVTISGCHENSPVDRCVAIHVTCPFRQVSAVEKDLVSSLGFIFREDESH